MMASESVALNQLGFKVMRDIKPGEAVIIQKGHAPQFRQVQQRKEYAPDIFEYVYFARPDSVIDGISVYRSRQKMGIKLAETILRTLSPEQMEEIDVVIPIPETSTTSAAIVATYLNKQYCQGFVKNRYVFSTYIMPEQKARQRGVRRKLNAQTLEFEGRNVLLVDDSIVRGTTSREIVLMAREAGAKKVYLASCAPPITHAHIYGIDLASPSELVAHNHHGVEAIAKHIGADSVIFQSLEDLKAACMDASHDGLNTDGPTNFEVGVFCGSYITPVDKQYFLHLEQIRGQSRKMKTEQAARQAVAHGIAEPEQIIMAANGAVVNGNGKVVPAAGDGSELPAIVTNGASAGERHSWASQEQESPDVKDRMDISLHNFADFPNP
jgi:amidophosphoribosyltransferase